MVSTLIALVLSLLVQVQSPNVPLDQKVQALQLAQKILVLAQQQPKDMPQGPTTVPVTVVVTPTPVNPSTPPAASAPEPVALIVPVCNLEITLSPLSNGRARVYFGWDMDIKATTGSLSGYGTLPAYTSHIEHPPVVSVVQNQRVVTYTLTETVTDPAYQETTTCEVTADTADL